jgi:hypothetical protein
MSSPSSPDLFTTHRAKNLHEEKTMNPQVNSLLVKQHQPDRARTENHYRRGHSQLQTRGNGAPTRWTRLAHAALNQAKMAAPRTASASSNSSAPGCA